jgi:hypothetical protein
MKSRVVLTVLWLLGFTSSLLLIEAYIHTRDANGIYILLQQDRWDCWRPLIVLFASYLTGILGFWFIKPFPSPPGNLIAERARFAIALTCTLLFLGILDLLLAEGFLPSGNESQIHTLVGSATTFAKWASFLVAPVNFYFFGMKK